ncbi:hypothetical protein ABKN59_011176 [Abortiporus biennis]
MYSNSVLTPVSERAHENGLQDSDTTFSKKPVVLPFYGLKEFGDTASPIAEISKLLWIIVDPIQFNRYSQRVSSPLPKNTPSLLP